MVFRMWNNGNREDVFMKAKFVSLAAAALMCAGCAESVVENPSSVTGGGDIIVRASVLDGPDTKTAFGEESDGVMSAVWSEGDRIVVKDNSSQPAKSAVYVLKEGAGESSGIFTFEEGDALSSMTDVVYPASAADDASIPAEQTYTEGSYDPEAAVLKWHSDTPESVGGVINLENTASIICIRLKGNETVASVTVDLTPAAGGEALTYTLVSENGVTLSDEEIPFYIAVPGADAEYGLSVSVKSVYESAEPLVQKTTGNKTFAASSLVRFPVLDYTYEGVLYAVGDYWPSEEDAEGIVFWVSDGGRHGKVISPEEIKAVWGPQISEAKAGVEGMRVNPEDARLITKSMIAKYKDTETFAADYPCFEWIYNTMNKGDIDGPWYAPSRKEVSQWAAAMSGFDWNYLEENWLASDGTHGYDVDKVQMPGWKDETAVAARKEFKTKLDNIKKGSGENLNLSGKYCSTWETSDGMNIFRFNLTADDSGGQLAVISKTDNTNRIRPIRTF